MKLSLDTEIEEIAELRAAIAIIEDAVKRRENEDEGSFSEESNSEHEENIPEQTSEASISEPEQNFEQQSNLSNEPTPEVNHVEPPPAVDLSPLSTSDFGDANESGEGLREPESNLREPEASVDNRSVVKEVINNLKNSNPGKPVYMQDIVDKAKEKSVSEDDTRNLVNELQSSGEI